MPGKTHKALVVLLLAATALGAVCPAAGAVRNEDVKRAIQRALAYLRQTQRADGNWAGGGHRGGVTSLALLALLHAGVPANDPAVQRGLRALDGVPNEATYVVGLKAQVYALLEDPKYIPKLQAAATFLIEAQNDNGMWSYGRIPGRSLGRGDNSNTQFALLGLHEAAKAGIKVPDEVWTRSRAHFVNVQTNDGGWGYRNENRAYGSMTTAGLASLYIVGLRLNVPGERVFISGAYPACGFYQQNVVLAAGLRWMADNFSVRENPGKGRGTWLYYYLYGMERVGMISGMRNFGRHDWYRQGAEFLVDRQGRGGSYGGVLDTSFALLFLSKGNRPVLIQKLRWKGSREPSWNRNLHDLENLTAWIGEKFGKRVAWQTASLELPLQELRVAPIVFITGHEFPPGLTGAEKKKLRAFVESGGTLLCEACCGKKAYDTGFRQFAVEAFPEYRLRRLDKTHPVFRSYYKMTELYDLHGIEVGCRTGVFYSPRALSCLWELQTIPKWSDLSFKLGTNIAAYATGKELLRDKLDLVELPARRKEEQLREVPRGAIRIARLIHQGDYKADIHCEANLAAMLRDQAKVDVVARGRHLRPNDEKIFEYPVVFMTGHFTFEWSEEEIAALRVYLNRGGCLIADSCCGRKAFDKSFRAMVAKLYPAKSLKPLPANHPIYTGQVGVPLGELRYRRILADQLKSRGTTHPPIEAVTVQGRTVILYSKYDWSCALEGDNPYSCRGYVDADGKKLALNLFLYAISY